MEEQPAEPRSNSPEQPEPAAEQVSEPPPAPRRRRVLLNPLVYQDKSATPAGKSPATDAEAAKRDQDPDGAVGP